MRRLILFYRSRILFPVSSGQRAASMIENFLIAFTKIAGDRGTSDKFRTGSDMGDRL